jgi:hypothetical protein
VFYKHINNAVLQAVGKLSLTARAGVGLLNDSECANNPFRGQVAHYTRLKFHQSLCVKGFQGCP